MFEPKGYVIVDKELKYTKEPGLGPDGKDLTKPYFDALKLKMVPVMDIAVDGSEYLVLGDSPEAGRFLWFMDKRDTISALIPYDLVRPSFICEGLEGLEWVVDLVQKLAKGQALSDEDDRLLREMLAECLGVHKKYYSNSV